MSDSRIFIFGDSIAYGAYDTEHSGWADRLKTWANGVCLQKESWAGVFNLSIPGANSTTLVSQIQNEVEQRLDSTDIHFCIIAYGANDLAVKRDSGLYRVTIDEFESNIQKAITKAQEFSKQVFCLTILPVIEDRTNAPGVSHKTRTNTDVDLYNERIKTACTVANATCIDVNQVFKNQNLEDVLGVDGLHPTSSGHKLLFETVHEQISSAVGLL